MPSMVTVTWSTIPFAVRVGVPAAVGVPALLDQANEENTPGAWALCVLAVVLSTASSLGRDRAPVRSFAAVLAVGITTQLTAAASGVEVTTLVVLPLGFAFYFLGRNASTTPSAIAAVASIVLMLGALALNQVTAAPERGGGLDVIAVVLALPLGWAVGVVVRAREQQLDQARRDQERQVELEDRRVTDARTQERLAIARDMHDVVAHSLTTLTVHAEVLRSRAVDLPQWANDRVDALATAARQANQELHGLLGTLRQEQPASEPSSHEAEEPAPRLSDLRGLATAAEQAGQHVTWDVGDTSGLSRLQESALYRITQECLNNARRHAPGATAHVRITRDAGLLTLGVTNEPPARGPSTPRNLPGLGLLGISERVTALGGEVRHGPTAEGGFAVVVHVPVLPAPASVETTS
ncbi:histidine kinase [Nocardioides sp. TF02-7]|uniref:sensor histidine kinase n=1 Tax=Nocardioides sp. TF02-7 TaxID=2917724 RepID=UPI001F06F6C0|nr:histidine kinase [Nocardioides sp. TF02-7]UMG92879.1 histidine kinase [Nocardioides sp. TF02-7]